jgi:hypothetical protein
LCASATPAIIRDAVEVVSAIIRMPRFVGDALLAAVFTAAAEVDVWCVDAAFRPGTRIVRSRAQRRGRGACHAR